MSANNGVLVRVKDVEKVFRRGSEEIHVLSGLNLEVPKGESVLCGAAWIGDAAQDIAVDCCDEGIIGAARVVEVFLRTEDQGAHQWAPSLPIAPPVGAIYL